MISESVRLINSGASEVHLTGYKTTTDLLDPGAHELAGDTDEEDEDEDYEKVLARRVRHSTAQRCCCRGFIGKLQACF